jgi:hypothetical protein
LRLMSSACSLDPRIREACATLVFFKTLGGSRPDSITVAGLFFRIFGMFRAEDLCEPKKQNYSKTLRTKLLWDRHSVGMEEEKCAQILLRII